LIIGNIISILLQIFFPPAAGFWTIFVLIPSLSLWTRRIRDTGLPGWWGFILIPIMLPLIFIAFTPTNYFRGISKKVKSKFNDTLDSRKNPSAEIKYMESLNQANQLLKDGAITHDEYDKIKKRILSNL
jgi:hypothetical protein